LGLLEKGSLIRNKIILMGGDVLAAIFALFLTIRQSPEISAWPMWTLSFIPVVILFSFLCEVYQPEKWIFKDRVIRSSFAAALSFLLLMFFPLYQKTDFLSLVICMIIFFIVQNCWQILFNKSNDANFFSEKIIVIGTGIQAVSVKKLIQEAPGKYTLIGYIKPVMEPVSVDPGEILGSINDIVKIAKQTNAHAIVIALTERRGNLVTDKLLTCKLMGVRIIDYPSFFELITGKIPIEHINPGWLVQSTGFLITPFIRRLKKILDIMFSSLLLTLCLPLFPIIAITIKLDSPGSIFYFQQRVGLNGKIFTIYKFRSMSDDSEKNTGAAWALENDPRVTRIGAFIRKTRIDELPQLINVLKGDMSFIGPRPERPEFVRQISRETPYYLERHAIKPGITGWAQIMYPYGASIGDSVEKLRYDLYYINNLSLFLELLIVFETIKIVLFRRGGR